MLLKCLTDRRDDPPHFLNRILHNKIFGLICCFAEDSTSRGTRYSLKAAQNRRGQRHAILVTNQLIPPIPPKRSPQAQYVVDEQDKSATSSKLDDSSPNRAEDGGGKEVTCRPGAWWRLGVVVDRLLFILVAVVFAVLWACYVGF